MKKLLIVLFSAIMLAGCNRQDVHQALGSKRILFSRANIVSQSFVSSAPNLNIVSICLRNPDRTLTPFEFTLHIATSSSQAIRTLEFTGGNIDNQDCTRFQFEPIPSSQGQLYVAQIKPKLGLEEDPRSNIYLEANQGDDYLGGQAYTDDVPTSYDLHFKTSYRQDLKTVLSESFSNFISRIFQDPIFFILYAISIICLIFLLKKNR